MLEIPSLNIFVSIFVLFITFLFICKGQKELKTRKQKIFIIFTSSVLYLYNGIGAGYEDVPVFYLFVYVVYLFVYISSFVMFSKMKFRLYGDENSYLYTKQRRNSLFSSDFFVFSVITVYLLTYIVLLVYPENLIYRLFSPPSIDVFSRFERFESGHSIAVMEKVLSYIQMLLKPLFFIAIYKYRNNFYISFLLIFLPLYFLYCKFSYVSRGDILIHAFFLFVLIWIRFIKYRKMIMYIILLLIPVMVLFFYQYAKIRTGGSVESIGFLSAFQLLLFEETSYPMHSIIIMEYNITTDLSKYFLWLFTLPIPKIFGSLDISEIPIEISELLLGLDKSSSGFYILLPGSVLESFYIYGKYFFWIHPLIIGFIAAFVCRITMSLNRFILLYAFVLIMFGWSLSRAGAFVVIPMVISPFYLFYFFNYIYCKYKIVINR